jgi:hypothetical protein
MPIRSCPLQSRRRRKLFSFTRCKLRESYTPVYQINANAPLSVASQLIKYIITIEYCLFPLPKLVGIYLQTLCQRHNLLKQIHC